jgi:transaldolase
MTKLHELARLGQSVWLDFIRRSLLEKGELRKLVEQGIRGVTSNPTIFDRAISGSDDYDEDLRPLSGEAKSPEEIFEVLAFRDITLAADILRPVYEATGGLDGYVSLEVSPRLAHDAAGTVAEVRRYFRTLDRPNVLIKVPATPAGIHAVQTLISEGININVTLIFSLAQYEAVAEAYISGLEKFHDRGGQIGKIASVASFFVSRVDTAVDRALEKMGLTELQGKAAVANAKLAYARFREIFGGERWQRLARKGARVQRPLWASTSTKNPKYPDTLYVDNLIGPDTVNTMPPETLAAVLDHGRVALTVEEGLDEARAHLARLAEVGIDLDKITQQLQDEGVDAFAKSFASLLASIAAKCEKIHGVF